MGWLKSEVKHTPSATDWMLFEKVMESVKEHLSKIATIGNYEDVYDRIFDNVMDKMMAMGTWHHLATIPILMRETQVAGSNGPRELQISEAKWKRIAESADVSSMEYAYQSVVESSILTELEGFLIIARYVYNHTLDHIAAILDCDAAYVRECLASISEKIIAENCEVEVYIQKPKQTKTIKCDPRYLPGRSIGRRHRR